MRHKIGWICGLLVLILCRDALASDCPFWKRSCQPQQSPEKRDFTPPSSRVIDPYSYSCTNLKVLQTCFFGDCFKTYCEGNKICITPEQDKSGKLKQAECLAVEINNLECSNQGQVKQQYYNAQYEITVEGIEMCPFDKPVCDAGECVAKKDVSECTDEDGTDYEALSGIQSPLNDLLLKRQELLEAGQSAEVALLQIEINTLINKPEIQKALGTLLTAKSVTGPDSSTGQVMTISDECENNTMMTEYACNQQGQIKGISILCNFFGPKSTCFADQKPNCVPTAQDKCLIPAKCLNMDTKVQQLAAGDAYTCALLGDQTVQCWGWNDYGQLGDGTKQSKLTPTSVANLGNVRQITAGLNRTCALLGDQTVKCWGHNKFGQLGDGTVGNFKLTPTPVSSLGNVKQITAGGAHTCALLGDQTVKCWGRNHFGQLGDGTTDDLKSIPTPVSSLGNVKQIAAGADHTCALLNDQTVKCWGMNSVGQLGDGTVGNFKSTPTPVSSLGNVKQITAGWTYTCALLGDQTVKCWGLNEYGQLGDGTSGLGNFKSTPIPIANLVNVKQIAARANHTCALLGDQTVKCWGANNAGQLGDGTTKHQPTPVEVKFP